MNRVISQSLTNITNQHSSYPLSILISLLTTLTMWAGYGDSLNFSNGIFDNEAIANLSYALSHKNAWGVPYPFTLRSLFNGFGKIGGVGSTLALIIAIALISHNRYQKKVAISSSLPVFFNINLPVIFGIPTILNPIYFIPFVLTPIVNMLLGSVAIFLKLFPSLVYAAPMGTPTVLNPLISTGGNWLALVWAFIILIVDVLIYIPFVILSNQVEEKYKKEQVNEKVK